MEPERDASAVTVQRRLYDDLAAIVVEWNFAVHGGSFGEREAQLFAGACAEAADTATPLVTILRSGGTRLQEGMRALVGIPRAVLALADVRAAHVPHIAVAASPTTGGVWVAIGSVADLRVGVRGATVGFSGPRVIEAMTGQSVPTDANTAQSALAAGLLDDVVDLEAVDSWVGGALRVLTGTYSWPTSAGPVVTAPERHGWAQVQHSRRVARPSGHELADALLDERMALRGADSSVAGWEGLLHGGAVVMVALAAERAGRA